MKTPVNEIRRKIWNARTKLLDMDYKITELADELGVTARYMRIDMIQKRGFPCWHDSTKHIWCNGKIAREWIENNFEPKNHRNSSKNPMAENEFYCVKCRARVECNSYTVIADRGTIYKKAYCPVCGTRMNKYLPKEGRKE